MPKIIVIPLYDHTDEQAIQEILENLNLLGFSNSPEVLKVRGNDLNHLRIVSKELEQN